MENWIRHFAKSLNLTGQVSFDFMEAVDDGRDFRARCNPRTHSRAIAVFYNHPDVAKAYLEPQNPLPQTGVPVPLASSRPTYWIYHENWQSVIHLWSPKRVYERLKIIAQGKDAIFEWDDPLPFLMVHHWHIPLLLLADLKKTNEWIGIDFNIGELVEIGGE